VVPKFQDLWGRDVYFRGAVVVFATGCLMYFIS
jgi:hypothetical protein